MSDDEVPEPTLIEYVTCGYCHQPMNPGTSCTAMTPFKGGVPPLPVAAEWATPAGTCRDCGAPVGGYHHPGCDTERCPICGGQAISCGDGATT